MFDMISWISSVWNCGVQVSPSSWRAQQRGSNWFAWIVVLFLLSFFILIGVASRDWWFVIVDGLGWCPKRKSSLWRKGIYRFGAIARALEGLTRDDGLGEVTNLR